MEKDIFDLFKNCRSDTELKKVNIDCFDLEERQEFFEIIYIESVNYCDRMCVPELNYNTEWGKVWLRDNTINEAIMYCNNLNELQSLASELGNQDCREICDEYLEATRED